MKRVAQLLALVLCVGSLYVGLTVFEVWRVGRTQSTTQVDAIVVMGAAQYDGVPSPLLKARLMHAFDLWKQKIAPRIVLTGGNKPGDRFTEASASAIFLRQQGVPQEELLQESLSRSTYEALRNVRDLVKNDANFAGIERIVIVTDPFHELRSRLTAKEWSILEVLLTPWAPASLVPVEKESIPSRYDTEDSIEEEQMITSARSLANSLSHQQRVVLVLKSQNVADAVVASEVGVSRPTVADMKKTVLGRVGAELIADLPAERHERAMQNLLEECNMLIEGESQ